jgi:channel protein (hemolysin III family)
VDETAGHPIYPIPGFAEPVSCWTHLLGAGVFLVLGIVLVRRGHGHWGRVTALGIFAFSCIFLLGISGTYHLLDRDSAARGVLQKLDHAAIFTLIAGTFTAVHAILFTGPWRWGMILAIWTMAATAVTLKMIFFHSVPEALSLSLYLGMGWVGLISGVKIARMFGRRFIDLLLFGAVAYTAGAVLEFLHWPVVIPGVIGPHELFHLAVLAGLFFHWRFIYAFASGQGISPIARAPGGS